MLVASMWFSTPFLTNQKAFTETLNSGNTKIMDLATSRLLLLLPAVRALSSTTWYRTQASW